MEECTLKFFNMVKFEMTISNMTDIWPKRAKKPHVKFQEGYVLNFSSIKFKMGDLRLYLL